MQPLRAELHLSILQNQVTGDLDVEISSRVQGYNMVKGGNIALGNTQIFTRLQEVLSNHLRKTCNQMEEILKKQRREQHE